MCICCFNNYGPSHDFSISELSKTTAYVIRLPVIDFESNRYHSTLQHLWLTLLITGSHF